MPARSSLPTLTLSLLATAAFAVAAGAGACSQTPPNQLVTTEGSGGGASQGAGGGASDGGSAGAASESGHKAFDALESAFFSACGTCHDTGGISDMPFLAGPDRYQSVISWPNFITSDPSSSRLLTYPKTGTGHPGKNLDAADLKKTLAPKLEAWLAIEAKAIDTHDEPKDAGKQIDPFAPVIGFNAVYLDALGSAYKGMALTFTAAQLDSSTLELTDVEVHPTATSGLHLVHPLFVVFPPNKDPDPDPVDSFSNVDQTFLAAQSGELGPGTMVLTNWVVGGRLDVAFETVEIVKAMGDGGTDGGSTSGCGALDDFNSSAKPAFKSNCFSCHGGADPAANAAIDMSKLDSDPAAACAQIKNRINTQTPANSQIFVTTDPGGNAVHPFKFNGSGTQFNNFKSTVTQWIQAEP